MTPNVTITAPAWHAITKEIAAVDGDGLETGGILVGHETADAVRITVAGEPGPNALRGPDGFLRDRAYAERLPPTLGTRTELNGWASGTLTPLRRWSQATSTLPPT